MTLPNWLYWMLGGNRRYCFIPSNHIARMARKWQASGEWEPTHGRKVPSLADFMPDWVMRGMQNANAVPPYPINPPIIPSETEQQ